MTDDSGRESREPARADENPTRAAARAAELELRKMLAACEKHGTGEPWASNVRALLAGMDAVAAMLRRATAEMPADFAAAYVQGALDMRTRAAAALAARYDRTGGDGGCALGAALDDIEALDVEVPQ